MSSNSIQTTEKKPEVIKPRTLFNRTFEDDATISSADLYAIEELMRALPGSFM